MSGDSFVFPRVPPPSAGRTHGGRRRCTPTPPLTELFSLQLQILGAISLQMFFFPPHPLHHFSCDGCSHSEPPRVLRRVVYNALGPSTPTPHNERDAGGGGGK